MYEFLREVLTLADIVKDVGGTIDTVDMNNLLPGLDRIEVTGTTGGKAFKVTLEVGEWKSE